MVESGLRMLQGSESFQFMYASGPTWTAGEVVVPDRVSQRVILGRTEGVSTREVRRIGDATWTRIWDDGEWSAVPDWAVPANPIVLVEKAAELAAGVRGVRLASTPRVARTPSGDRLPSHLLSGWIKVAALSNAGLRPSGNPPDNAEVRFNMLVERETGLPVEFVFHGVPPAHSPLAVLHVFDYNSLGAEGIVEPKDVIDVSVAVDSSTEAPATDGAGESTPAARLPPTALAQALATPEASPEAPPQADMVYVEQVVGREESWVRYVLPTEGYTVEAPAYWDVTAGYEGVEVSDGRMDGIHGVDAEDGSRWSVYRMAARGSLLEMGQRRVGLILADPSVEQGSLAFRTEEMPAGSSVRIEYRVDGDPGRWVCEYVVVRGSPGLHSGLGYNIELSGSSPERKSKLEAIAATFALLGVEP